jgi:hypothetical protein
LKENEFTKVSDSTDVKVSPRASEEVEKKKKKQTKQTVKKESNSQKSRVLYKIDATDLKMADRKKRIIGTAVIFIAELALIFPLAYFLGLLAIPLYVAIVYFMPPPIVPAPSKYEITNQGISLSGQSIFPLKSGYTLQDNQIRKFISIRRARRGEVLKLYTSDFEKVMTILDKLIKESKK